MDKLAEAWSQLPPEKYLNLDTGNAVSEATALKKAVVNKEFHICSNADTEDFMNLLFEIFNFETVVKNHGKLTEEQWLNVDTGRKVKHSTALTKAYQDISLRICGDTLPLFTVYQQLCSSPSSQEKLGPPGKPTSRSTASSGKLVSSGKLASATNSGPVTRSQTKKTIPPKLKEQIWSSAFGNVMKHVCWCCRDTSISGTSFHAGHIQAEAKGGSIDPDNLRPICQSCNSSMRTQNMIEYMSDKRPNGWKHLLLEDPLLAFCTTHSNVFMDWNNFMDNYRKWCHDHKLIVWSESAIKVVLDARGHLASGKVNL